MEERYTIDILDYDSENDNLFFKSRSREYKSSIDFNNIILDIGIDGIPVGAEILNASKLFNVPKSAIKNIITFRAEFYVSEEIIKINFTMSVTISNRETERTAALQYINNIDIPSSHFILS